MSQIVFVLPTVEATADVLTTAILDRLLHRSHVLDIRGRSYPLKELEEEAKKRP